MMKLISLGTVNLVTKDQDQEVNQSMRNDHLEGGIRTETDPLAEKEDGVEKEMEVNEGAPIEAAAEIGAMETEIIVEKDTEAGRTNHMNQ